MSDNFLLKIISYLNGESQDTDFSDVLRWKKENPEAFDQLKRIIENTPFENIAFHTEAQKSKILAQIRNTQKETGKGKRISLNFWFRIAAIFIGLISLTIAGYLYHNSLSVAISNPTTEILDVDLPDGSVITLDQGATISYKKDWLNHFNRNVSLSGRAFFKIQKQAGKHFKVNASKYEIEVLGTQFMVSDQYEKFQVVLQEGKVRVGSKTNAIEYLLNKFGEQLIIDASGQARLGIVSRNLYFSWLSNRLNFENCRVSETIDFLSDSYNINIKVEDSTALATKLYGAAPSDSPLLIIEAISKITETEIVKIDNEIILK